VSVAGGFQVSKSLTTRWYIGAWVVGAISTIVFFMSAHTMTTSASVSAFGTSPISVIAWIVAGICAIVMLVMWIGALMRLGRLHSWGWFVFMLVLQLIGLGIIPMVAYAAAGPEEAGAVTRPSVT
jgi:hypothetical protein